MATETNSQREAITAILEKAKVTFTVGYVGQRAKQERDSKPWKCDEWAIAFKSEHGVYSTEYFTGLGHREKHRTTHWNHPYHCKGCDACTKPKAPHAADVLYCLLLDAEADSMSFGDWCSDFGYSDDSITALDTYRKCCDTAKGLRRVFMASKAMEELREALRDY